MESTSPNTEIDELLKQLDAAEENIQKVLILTSLSGKLMYSDPDQVMKYAEEGLKISDAIGFKEGIARCLNAIGIVYKIKSDYAKALVFFHKSLKTMEELDDKSVIGACLMNIGVIYCSQDNHAKALEYYFKSLAMYEELADKSGICLCLRNVGIVYTLIKDYPKALEYCHKSLEIAEELGDRNHIYANLSNIGILYGSQNNYAQAQEYFYKSLKIAEELNDKSGIASCLSNIGIIFKESSDYPKAWEYYHKSLEIAKKLGEKKGIATLYVNMGELCLETNKIQEALNYLNEALNLSKRIGVLDLTKQIYENLSGISERLNDPSKALEYYKLYKETSDKNTHIEQAKKIVQMESRFALEKKEQEILILKETSITDTLTKLLNRQGIREKMKDEINRFSRSKKPFVVSIADIDDFKQFNDKFGHNCGDSVLRAFASVLRTSIRSQDHVGRWGGEEFLIILPETDLDGGLKVTEKIRKAIEDYSHNYQGNTHYITSSFGLSEYRGEVDIDIAIEEADKALYAAKMRGKNCCITADNLQ